MESLLYHNDSKLYNHFKFFMKIIENDFPIEIIMYGDGMSTKTKVETLIKKKIDDSVFIILEDFECTEIINLLQLIYFKYFI